MAFAPPSPQARDHPHDRATGRSLYCFFTAAETRSVGLSQGQRLVMVTRLDQWRGIADLLGERYDVDDLRLPP